MGVGVRGRFGRGGDGGGLVVVSMLIDEIGGGGGGGGGLFVERGWGVLYRLCLGCRRSGDGVDVRLREVELLELGIGVAVGSVFLRSRPCLGLC